MATFDIGETVICSCEVKDGTGAYKDPSTSMTITIIGRGDFKHVADVAMTKNSVGHYHYDFNSVGVSADSFTVVYKATDGTRITIEKERFDLN